MLKDDASSAEVFVQDEAGNVTKLSPHNQLGNWEYYSKNVKTGKVVRIDMEEMIKDIEQLTGKKYNLRGIMSMKYYSPLKVEETDAPKQFR